MLKKIVNFIWKKKAVIIVLILSAGIFVGYKIISGKEDGYVLGTAQKRTITEIVTESGIIAANGRVNIYSPTNGIVSNVFVSNRESIKENQVLFTVKQAENTRRETLATVERVHDMLKITAKMSLSHKKRPELLQR